MKHETGSHRLRDLPKLVVKPRHNNFVQNIVLPIFFVRKAEMLLMKGLRFSQEVGVVVKSMKDVCTGC